MKKFIIVLVFSIIIQNNVFALSIPPDIDVRLIDLSFDYNIDVDILRAFANNESAYGRYTIHINYNIPEKCKMWHTMQLISYGIPLTKDDLFLHSVDLGPLQFNSMNYELVSDLCNFDDFYSNSEMQLIGSARFISRLLKSNNGYQNTIELLPLQYRYGSVTGMTKYQEYLTTGILDNYAVKWLNEYKQLKGIK